jgi:hypothetical protein
MEHSNANLNTHSKMTTNNVSSIMNFQQICEQKVVPGLKIQEKNNFFYIFY